MTQPAASNHSEVKQEVRQFYDQVGWSLVGEDRYQNARYEDLRPVSSEYIHRCHLRVGRHIAPSGKYLLDAGSGPIQYPEYLEYSRPAGSSAGYKYRVCADISITALKEARKRIERIYPTEEHGLFVVADVANLPFKSDVFEGIVSLHTIHHLPEDEHLRAYRELYRLLAPEKSAVVVNGWPGSPLMSFFEPLVRLSNRVRSLANRISGRAKPVKQAQAENNRKKTKKAPTDSNDQPKGTFTSRHDVAWIKEVVGGQMSVDILVWRSASVRFLRAVIIPWLGGRYWLRLLFTLEERYPHYFGENGQYPLIVIRK
jgi:SAM-dependent methyltransferase